VLLRVDGLGEATGRLDDDVDAELAPREVRRVALFEDLDGLAVDGDGVSIVRDLGVEAAADGVVLEQLRPIRPKPLIPILTDTLSPGSCRDGDDVSTRHSRTWCVKEKGCRVTARRREGPGILTWS